MSFTFTFKLFFRYKEDLELEDAIHTAILALKEGFEGHMTADNIEVGVCRKNRHDEIIFEKLDQQQVADYLANIPN